jgi:peptidoglycan hydrolase CwlO-like protein
MKTGKIETLTLAMGGLVLVAAAIMTFGFGNNPKAAVWTNITLSLGFLVYILYNVGMSINNSKKINGLQETVASLEADVSQLETQRNTLQTSLQQSQTDLTTAQETIQNLTADLEEKKQTITQLETQLAQQIASKE